jgi:hypothetical protein
VGGGFLKGGLVAVLHEVFGLTDGTDDTDGVWEKPSSGRRICFPKKTKRNKSISDFGFRIF